MNDPACTIAPYNQLHAYLAALTKSFDPLLFDYHSAPLLFREENRPPFPAWKPSAFNVAYYGKHYDYVLVQGLKPDPLEGPGKSGVKLVKQAGMWRLYELERTP